MAFFILFLFDLELVRILSMARYIADSDKRKNE
jgi:hypothetical protein